MNKTNQPYYFKTRFEGIDEICLELCMVRKNDVMIGSVECINCMHCVKSYEAGNGTEWIICEKITEAIKK